MSEPKKIVPKPADIRGISDPPDMGRIRPAWKVAEEQLRHGRLGQLVEAGGLSEAEERLADVIRQSRAEGAAAALEEAAMLLDAKAGEQDIGHGDPRDLGMSDAYDDAASILRARAKGISDPPDMG